MLYDEMGETLQTATFFGPAVVGLAYTYVTIDDEDVIKA
jgi:hypothetical protein